jgi:hypothetical protein
MMPVKWMVAGAKGPSPKSREAPNDRRKQAGIVSAPLRYRFSLPAASSDAAGFILPALLERSSRLD